MHQLVYTIYYTKAKHTISDGQRSVVALNQRHSHKPHLNERIKLKLSVKLLGPIKRSFVFKGISKLAR